MTDALPETTSAGADDGNAGLEELAGILYRLLAGLEDAYRCVGMDPDAICAIQRDWGGRGYSLKFPELGRKLAEILPGLQDEFNRRCRETSRLEAELRDRLTILEQSPRLEKAVQQTPAPQNQFDPCTGLPTRPEAQQAIRRALTGKLPVYIAVFYLHRMAVTNARFGEAIADQMLLFCSQHIATRLTKLHDSLFRWRGPAFVVVLEREDSLLTVNSEVQRLLSAPLRRFFELPSRTVYLPLKLTGTAFAAADRTDVEIFEQIENYVANVHEPG